MPLRLLLGAELERTETAISVVISAQARRPVGNAAALFSAAWLGRWVPTPTPAELAASRDRLAAKAKAETERKQVREAVRAQAATEGQAAALLARLSEDVRAALRSEARLKGETAARTLALPAVKEALSLPEKHPNRLRAERLLAIQAEQLSARYLEQALRARRAEILAGPQQVGDVL